MVLLAGVGGTLSLLPSSQLCRSLFVSLVLAVGPGFGAPLKLPHLSWRFKLRCSQIWFYGDDWGLGLSVESALWRSDSVVRAVALSDYWSGTGAVGREALWVGVNSFTRLL